MSEPKKSNFSINRRGSIATLVGASLIAFASKGQAKEDDAGLRNRLGEPPQKDIFKTISFD